jgi:hypothetical protein
LLTWVATAIQRRDLNSNGRCRYTSFTSFSGKLRTGLPVAA